MLASCYPEADITVLVPILPNIAPCDYELFRPEEVSRVKYLPLTADAWFYRTITVIKWLPLFTLNLLIPVIPGLKKLWKIIKFADLVVSAPGGVDLGPYRSWSNLFRLILSIQAGKPTAIYSPSIGPLPDETREDRRFTRLAKHILKKVDFLSLRMTRARNLPGKFRLIIFSHPIRLSSMIQHALSRLSWRTV